MRAGRRRVAARLTASCSSRLKWQLVTPPRHLSLRESGGATFGAAAPGDGRQRKVLRASRRPVAGALEFETGRAPRRRDAGKPPQELVELQPGVALSCYEQRAARRRRSRSARPRRPTAAPSRCRRLGPVACPTPSRLPTNWHTGATSADSGGGRNSTLAKASSSSSAADQHTRERGRPAKCEKASLPV